MSVRTIGDLLFTVPGSSKLDAARNEMLREIEKYDEGRFVNTNVDDLTAYFSETYTVRVPQLGDDISMAHDAASVDVNNFGRRVTVAGTRWEFRVPFEGDPVAFTIHGSQLSLNPPKARVGEDALTFVFETPDADASRVDETFRHQLGEVREGLQWLGGFIAEHNAKVAADARRAIEQRRDRIQQRYDTADALGYRLRKRPDAPTTFAAPSIRRKLRPPPPTSAPGSLDPTMTDRDYEHVLSVIENMALVLERSPNTFSRLEEEELRDHFLVQLNGQYEGGATGETFNVGGKTDILVREGGKNLFIAECKFWRGPASFVAAIDQLLSYTSWRDTKTAIILFHRGKGFSEVLAKVPGLLAQHPCFVRASSSSGETRHRAVLHHPSDPKRALALTVLAFDVPRHQGEGQRDIGTKKMFLASISADPDGARAALQDPEVLHALGEIGVRATVSKGSAAPAKTKKAAGATPRARPRKKATKT